MKSDTPKTDAEQEAISWIHDTRRFIVDAEFARTLERELAAERAAREQCEARLKDAGLPTLEHVQAIYAIYREKARVESIEKERDALRVEYESREGRTFGNRIAWAISTWKNFFRK